MISSPAFSFLASRGLGMSTQIVVPLPGLYPGSPGPGGVLWACADGRKMAGSNETRRKKVTRKPFIVCLRANHSNLDSTYFCIGIPSLEAAEVREIPAYF